MSLPDPDQASWITKAAAAAVAAAGSFLGLFKLINKKDSEVVKGHGEAIAELQRNQRDDKIELHAVVSDRAERLHEQIQSLADTQRLDREAILQAIREDRRETRDTLEAIKDGFSGFREHVAGELGRRPTRDELPHGLLFQQPRSRDGG